MIEKQKELFRNHLEQGVDECRWCFAVDLERVKGDEIARYTLTAVLLFLLSSSISLMLEFNGTRSNSIP